MSIPHLVDFFIHWWTPELLPSLLWITPLWTWVCKYLCQFLLWLGLDRGGQAISGRLKHCRPAPYFRVFFPCSEWVLWPPHRPVAATVSDTPRLSFPSWEGLAQRVRWLRRTFWTFLPSRLRTRMCDSNSRRSTSPEISMTFKIGKNLIGGYGNLSPREGL